MNYDVLLDGWPTCTLIVTTLLFAAIIVCLLVDAVYLLTMRAERRRSTAPDGHP